MTKPGFECRHNNAYWRYKDYLSFGTSSHSFMNGKRWWNYSSLKHYISVVDENGNAEANYEMISENQKFDEYVMLALRSSGINLSEFKKLFGENWINENNAYLKKLADQKLLNISEENISLTKSGYAVCDEILSNIL